MSTRAKNPQIYVKGYGTSINRQDLKSWFKSFGKIVCIQYKGPYSFIEFQDYYDAQAAIKEMNGKKVEGCRLIVEPSGMKKVRNRSRSQSRGRRQQRTKPRRKRYQHQQSSSSFSSSDSSSRSSNSSSSSSSSSSEESKKKNSNQKKQVIPTEKKQS